MKYLPMQRHALASEGLKRLRFEDAFNDCLVLSELAMDMVEAFSSRAELIWIQNGFKPSRKTHRVKPRRQRGRP
jgi:hypothetical protein